MKLSQFPSLILRFPCSFLAILGVSPSLAAGAQISIILFTKRLFALFNLCLILYFICYNHKNGVTYNADFLQSSCMTLWKFEDWLLINYCY